MKLLTIAFRILWRAVVAFYVGAFATAGLFLAFDRFFPTATRARAVILAIGFVGALLAVVTFWYWDVILISMKGLICLLLQRIFPPLSYKGVVNTQIAVYEKLKKEEPTMAEDELLNLVILSRVQAPPRAARKEVEYMHYEPLLNNPDKTLEDVIWAIVDYEYVLSRSQIVVDQGLSVGLSLEETLSNIDAFMSKVRMYIRKRIEKKVLVRNNKRYREPLANCPR